MRIFAFIVSFMVAQFVIAAETTVSSVLVDKSEQTMFLLSGGEVVRKYHVVFGANPLGHKQQQGDERTPEGNYILDYKKPDSSFHKAIHVSYPNEKDKSSARERGVDPGGLIMIHGQKNGFGWMAWLMQNFNWTDGCIAVTNKEMDEIWSLVKIGTPIEIRP